MTKPDQKRAYLTVPFSKNEEVKKHGARWDPRVKRWWIARHDLAANPGIHRWVVDVKLVTKARLSGPARGANSKLPATSPRKDFSLPDCVCLTAPWEHCEHSKFSAGKPVLEADYFEGSLN